MAKRPREEPTSVDPRHQQPGGYTVLLKWEKDEDDAPSYRGYSCSTMEDAVMCQRHLTQQLRTYAKGGDDTLHTITIVSNYAHDDVPNIFVHAETPDSASEGEDDADDAPPSVAKIEPDEFDDEVNSIVAVSQLQEEDLCPASQRDLEEL